MKGLIVHIYVKLTFIVLFCFLFISSGCSTTDAEGFAIYLTKGDIPPARMEALSHVNIADQPVIAIKDIIVYNAQTHEITLTANAYARISNLEIPVRGRSFVVCVDRKLIYWGAFWTPVSSISFDGVTIWKPLISQYPNGIKLELGYPSSSFYRGEDPRNNAEVMASLKHAGKLTAITSATTVDKIPHSMKGYELYSWQEYSQWHFTLITGTNRNKTLEEIISSTSIISEDGWVHIHVVGVDAIKTVLSRVPQSEFVLWLARIREQTGQTDIKIQLPSGQITAAIKEHAVQCGLDFQVQSP